MAKHGSETWRLSQEDVALWLKHADIGKTIKLAKGERLYTQGEVTPYFYIITKGEIRVSIFEHDGGETIIEVMGPWGLCGEAPAFDGLPRFTSATATRTSEVIRYDARRLGNAFAEEPGLALSLLKLTSVKQRVLAVRLEYAFAYSPQDRLLQVLHRIANLYGTRTSEGKDVGVRLTHEQLASMTGTSRVTVTRILNQLRAKKIIATKGNSILLLTELAPDYHR